MRSFIYSMLILSLFACSVASATPADVQREIQSEYDKLAAAFAVRDLQKILTFRSPEFETFGPQGQHDDYERMAEYTRIWLQNNQPPIEVKFTIESIEIGSSDRAVVRVLQRASRYQEIDGKRRRVEHEVRQRETWIRTSQGWKIRMVDEIDLANRKRWIDGELQ